MDPFNPDDLVALLAESQENLTASAYIRKISDHLGITRSRARKILTGLVNRQKVAYQSLYGATYVMEYFLKPVRITDRFYIAPPGIKNPAGPGALTISIHQGISFGSGHHPTTRLCLEALDHLFFTSPFSGSFPGNTAGDVGTGSGVLAIAACLAGMDTCTAWDIDPNAVSEARQNAAASGLNSQISVIDDYMSPQNPPMALICANLRPPTLKQLASLFKTSLVPGGFLVLSGLRDWEKIDLLAVYRKLGFFLFWENTHKHWTGLALRLEADSA